MKQRLRDLEARENWIAARVDELMDDADFAESFEWRGIVSLREFARKEAEREHAAIMAGLEDERIEQWRCENGI